MALQPFKDEQLNYFKFASIVLNEFPKALRQTFRSMWDNTFGHRLGFQPWDDSNAVRNLFLGEEGGRTKVPTNISYEEWDCTALFQATIYSRSFALPDSTGHHKTLSDLYVKPHKLTHGSFHVSLARPGGNKAETFALAIDQLRLLRNSLCHSTSSEIVKTTFDLYVQYSKDAFKALGVKTDSIDVVGGLTESYFPTKEVRKLEQAMKEETLAYIKFLEEIDELRELLTEMKAVNASKEDIDRLEQKINDLCEVKPDSRVGTGETHDTKPSLPKSCLEPMVSDFTGRQKEVEEITGHVTSKSTRIVSIWGSPGFGKTSVAIAVGHHLHSQGYPVYYLSLRDLQSKADLASKLLSLFRRPVASDQQSQQRLLIHDELCYLLREISNHFTIILDNADDLWSGKLKEHFTHFIADILRRAKKVTFIITTRESLECFNWQSQGHQRVRISPLDEPSSQTLVNRLLPNATVTDCKRVTQICGHVPLAMKLLCSYISEYDLEPSQALDDFMGSLENPDIVEMLDKSDYSSDLSSELLFDSSFQRLSAEEKEALVSLCVLPESFDLTVAAAVLGLSKTLQLAKIMLGKLRRKSLLESSSKSESFSMHPLIRSFANEIGKNEMEETNLKSRARLSAFYLRRFKDLNEKFLTGDSMSAFIDFYQDEQSIEQSLILKGCSDSKTAKSVFEVLVKAELFLCSLYFRDKFKFHKIYDSALKMATTLKEYRSQSQLLVSKALYQVTWGARGGTMRLLSKAKKFKVICPSVSVADKGKRLCYEGIYQLVNGQTEIGVQSLEEVVSLMSGSPEKSILRIIAVQILATYYRLKNDLKRTSELCNKALEDCKTTENTELLIIPNIPTFQSIGNEKRNRRKEMRQQPLTFQIICLVSEAVKHLENNDTTRFLSDAVQQIAKDIEISPVHSSLGLFIFQRNVNITLQKVLKNFGSVLKVAKKEDTSWHEMSLYRRRMSSESHGRVDTSKLIPGRRNNPPASMPARLEEVTAQANTFSRLIEQREKQVRGLKRRLAKTVHQNNKITLAAELKDDKIQTLEKRSGQNTVELLAIADRRVAKLNEEMLEKQSATVTAQSEAMSARNAQLAIDNESLRNELQNSRADYTALQVDMNDVRDYYHQVDIAASKMCRRCEMLGQLNASLEEQKKALVEQVNKLVEQNQDLVKSLEDKDQFMDDERAFSDRIFALQRQKERLEEQLDLANKTLAESAVKPKKKRNFLTRVMRKAGLKKKKDESPKNKRHSVQLLRVDNSPYLDVPFRSSVTHDMPAFRARKVRSEIHNDSDWSPGRLGWPWSMESPDRLPSSSSTLTFGDGEPGDGLSDKEEVRSTARYLKQPGMKHLTLSALPSGMRKHHWARSSPNLSSVVSRKEYPVSLQALPPSPPSPASPLILPSLSPYPHPVPSRKLEERRLTGSPRHSPVLARKDNSKFSPSQRDQRRSTVPNHNKQNLDTVQVRERSVESAKRKVSVQVTTSVNASNSNAFPLVSTGTVSSPFEEDQVKRVPVEEEAKSSPQVQGFNGGISSTHQERQRSGSADRREEPRLSTHRGFQWQASFSGDKNVKAVEPFRNYNTMPTHVKHTREWSANGDQSSVKATEPARNHNTVAQQSREKSLGGEENDGSRIIQISQMKEGPIRDTAQRGPAHLRERSLSNDRNEGLRASQRQGTLFAASSGPTRQSVPVTAHYVTSGNVAKSENSSISAAITSGVGTSVYIDATGVDLSSTPVTSRGNRAEVSSSSVFAIVRDKHGEEHVLSGLNMPPSRDVSREMSVPTAASDSRTLSNSSTTMSRTHVGAETSSTTRHSAASVPRNGVATNPSASERDENRNETVHITTATVQEPAKQNVSSVRARILEIEHQSPAGGSRAPTQAQVDDSDDALSVSSYHSRDCSPAFRKVRKARKAKDKEIFIDWPAPSAAGSPALSQRSSADERSRPKSVVSTDKSLVWYEYGCV